MDYVSIVRFARYSPRKVGRILDLIRNKSVNEAFGILNIINKGPKVFVQKALKSALANSGRLKKPEGMFVKECFVGQGPAMKRWRARAFGRAVQYKHRTCHLTIKVGERPGSMPAQRMEQKASR
jgi:large subunit ribosomal protein L22